MERALFVLRDDDSNENLLRDAGELASGVDAELVVLTLLTVDELETGLDTLETIADIEQTGYDESMVLKSAITSIETLIEETFPDSDVRCKAVAKVHEGSDEAEAIIEAGEEYNCDHVFMSGRKRSPTGKVVFGDTTQAVLLNFDGRVTVELV